MDHGKREVGEIHTLQEHKLPPREKEKNPPPSETRWLFYRDTLMAILDQPDIIEDFLNFDGMREKISNYLESSKHPLGALKDVPFSFTDHLVNAHFDFAFFVLDILGEINTIFQEKYGFVPYLWEYITSLCQFLIGELRKIEGGDLDAFPLLKEVEEGEICQFTKILKSLILNLEVRFFDISSSLNKKAIKSHLDYDRMAIGRCPAVEDRVVCGVPPVLDVFYVKDVLCAPTWLDHSRMRPLAVSGDGSCGLSCPTLTMSG